MWAEANLTSNVEKTGNTVSKKVTLYFETTLFHKNSFNRVFKKGSPNGKITVYLGRRDFVDHISHVDPIDGVVLVDPEYLNGRKVFGHVLAAFRYGREDLDVLGKSKSKKKKSSK